MHLKSTLTALMVSAAGLAHPAFGQITISDFSTASGLHLNGNASIAGSALRLTPALPGQAGSTFSTSAITLAANVSFNSFLTLRITDSGGISDGDGVGADGLVFVVQTNANNVGGAVGGIGYLGMSNSLGVEFDTYDNGTGFGERQSRELRFRRQFLLLGDRRHHPDPHERRRHLERVGRLRRDHKHPGTSPG